MMGREAHSGILPVDPTPAIYRPFVSVPDTGVVMNA